MRKPNDLQAWLINSVHELQSNPEKLQIYIEQGSLNFNPVGGLHFEYRYNLTLLVIDFAADTDNLIVPLLAWVKVNQPEIADDAIQLEAEIIDKHKTDISVSIPLTEHVLVTTNSDGNYITKHPAEPVPDYNLPDPALLRELIPHGRT